MATVYDMSLDGFSFARDEVFFRGPLEVFSEQIWSEQDTLGSADPGTILTFLGTKSPKWPFDGTFLEASKDKLLAIYDARLPVTFITPQDGTGFLVLLRDLDIEHEVPSENGKFRCTFTLTKRT